MINTAFSWQFLEHTNGVHAYFSIRIINFLINLISFDDLWWFDCLMPVMESEAPMYFSLDFNFSLIAVYNAYLEMRHR